MNSKKLFKQYFTSEGLSNILLKSIDESIRPKNIIDLSVGEGNLLKAAKSRWGLANLYGIDLDPNIIQNLKKTMNKEVMLINEDALNIPVKKEYMNYFDIIENGGFDLCLANPPYGRIKKIDLFGNERTLPLELLFLTRYIEICREGGIIAIILPNGVLTNSKYSNFREYLIKKTEVQKVISLPINAFPEVSIKTEILILKKNTTFDRFENTVIFEKYNSKLVLEKIFKKQINRSELIKRIDFEYHCPATESKHKDRKSQIKYGKLSDFLFSQSRGATEYGIKRKFESSGIKYIHTTNIGDITINFVKDQKYIAPNSQMFKPKALLIKNDVVMVRVGKNVGKCSIIHSEKDIGVASDCLYILRFQDAESAYYFTAIMQTEFMKSQINRVKYGSCSTLIRKEDVSNLVIPIFSNEIKKSIVYQLKKLIDLYQKQLIDVDNFIERKDFLTKKLERIIRGRF